MSEYRLSDIIRAKAAKGQILDGSGIAALRDKYMGALRSGQTQDILIDDTAEGMTWTPKKTENGLEWWPEEKPLIDADPGGAYAYGRSSGAIGNPPTGGFREDPLGAGAHLLGMLQTAKGIGQLTGIAGRAGKTVVRRMLAKGAEGGIGLGAYGGVSSIGQGQSAPEVVQRVALDTALGAGLGVAHAAPGLRALLASLPGEAALWAGFEKVTNPDATAEDMAAAALGGLAVSRIGGKLGGLGSTNNKQWRVVEESRPTESSARNTQPGEMRLLEPPPEVREMLPMLESGRTNPQYRLGPGEPRPSLMLPPGNPPTRGTPSGSIVDSPSPIMMPGSISPVGEARLDARPWELIPVPEKSVEPASQRITEPADAPPTRVETPPPETTPARRTPAQRKAEIAKIAAAKKSQLEQATIQESVAPVDPAQLEREMAVAGFLAKQEAPGSPMPNDLPQVAPITPAPASARHKRTGRVLGPAAKAEPVALPEYEHLDGIDYLNRKTGEVFTRVPTPKGQMVYLPTSPEYAARARQKAAGVGKPQTMSAPVGKDVTLGVGLGGAQDLMGIPTKGLLNKIAPQGLPPRQVQADIPASVAANKFLTTGDIYELYRLTNAIRDHKPSVEFMARIPEMGVVSQPDISPRTEIIQGVTGGRIANKEQLETLGTLEDLHLVELELAGQFLEAVEKTMATGPAGENIRPRSKVDKAAASISEHVSTGEVALSDAALMSKPEINAVLGKLSPTDQALALNMARRGREFYDDLIQKQNIVAAGIDEPPIAYRDNYLPHMEEAGFLAGLTQDAPLRSGYQKEAKRFRPGHTKKRTGDMENRKESLLEITELYSQAAAKFIGNNLAIAHMRSYTNALRKAGKGDAADQLQRVVDVHYGGKTDRITELVDRATSGAPALVTGRRVGHLLSELASDAQLGLNLGFVFGTMPTSIDLVDAAAGPRAAVATKLLMSNPGVRKWVKSVSYAYTIKAGGGEGSVVNQDIVGSRGKYRNRGFRSFGAARHEIRHLFSLATQRMELELSMYSFVAGYSKAKLGGATEAEAIAVGDNYIKEFQVMLDRANSSEVSMSRDTNMLAKYSRFPIQMYNNIRKRWGFGLGKTGAYRAPEFGKWGAKEKAMALAMGFALLFVRDQIFRQMTGRSLYGISSAVPFASQMGLGESYGKYSNLPFIAQQYKMAADAALSTEALLKDGDYSKYLKYLSSNIIPGGSPTSRWMSGDKADREGGWWPENAPGYAIDSSGFATYDPTKMTLPFVGGVDLPGRIEIPNLLLPKKLQMRLFGVHSVKEGQEYWAEKDRRRR
jgi:hypothetical protein